MPSPQQLPRRPRSAASRRPGGGEKLRAPTRNAVHLDPAAAYIPTAAVCGAGPAAVCGGSAPATAPAPRVLPQHATPPYPAELAPATLDMQPRMGFELMRLENLVKSCSQLEAEPDARRPSKNHEDTDGKREMVAPFLKTNSPLASTFVPSHHIFAHLALVSPVDTHARCSRPLDGHARRRREGSPLAPLHNPQALRWVEAAREHAGRRRRSRSVQHAFFGAPPARPSSPLGELGDELGMHSVRGIAEDMWRSWCSLRTSGRGLACAPARQAVEHTQ